MVKQTATCHLTTARMNGVIRTEMVESLTHVAFYAGWPSAWAVFGQAKEVYVDDCGKEEHGGFFGQGASNDAMPGSSLTRAISTLDRA